MAISSTHYHLLKLLRERGELPQGGRMLELGMANFYGDMDVNVIRSDIETLAPEGMRKELRRRLDAACGVNDLFIVAECIYGVMFGVVERNAIDIDPLAFGAMRHNLNTVTAASGDFGVFSVAINNGTLEHIGNDSNGFRLMHDATEVGGLMIHEAPFTGWIDHGLRNYQPTYFYDLAHDNGYEIILLATEHLASRTAEVFESREQIHEKKRREQLADNLMLFVALRKGADVPFKDPQQGVYAGTVSQEVQQAWGELR